MKLSKYQERILVDMENGAKLQSSEGYDYKAWLVYPNGETRNIRRQSAELFTVTFANDLVFGEEDGIRWRASSPKLANQRSPFGMWG